MKKLEDDQSPKAIDEKLRERLKKPREPILTRESSRLQIFKTSLDNAERQLAILRLGGIRRGNSAAIGALVYRMERLKLALREEQGDE
jgi:hypothetical protein